MNYDELSDFEINLAVAKILELKLTDGQHYKPSVAHWDSNGYLAEFNPCGNWADIGPIITDNKISITNYHSADSMAFIQSGGFMHFMSEGKNPLRAAAICFLKMQEKK